MDAEDIWQKRKSFVENSDCASTGGGSASGEHTIGFGSINVPKRASSGDLLPQVEDEDIATSQPLLSDTEHICVEQCRVDETPSDDKFVTPETLAGVAAKLSPLQLAGSKTSILSDRSGTHLSFHNLTYSVEVRVGKCCGENENKLILNNVSGLCRPGMNAILGPTGSGKSSLLDVLAGRKDKVGLSGHVLVDGDTQPVNFKCMSGYVIQDDIVMGMLTVRENIQFSAALRLPKTMSSEKRNQRVEEVISELGLTKCAGTRVGTEFTRGISGGERKRTNIAMELITSPSVLFLDEPTTGLDSNTANSVMHLLQRLSRKGKTIIFSIHQPRYSIFKLFDSMMLLSQGESVYHGPAADALEHFENIGYVCEEHNNPSDFFLDILNGCLQPVCSTESDQYAAEICPSTEKNIDGKLTVIFIPEAEDGSTDLSARQQSLVQHYQKSTWHQSLQTELSQIASDYEKVDKHDSARRGRNLLYSTSFPTQLAILSSRTFRNMIRNPHGFVTQLFSAIILGLIVGTIYYQTDSTAQSGIQNRVGAFFFIVMNYVFGNMAAVDIFIKERSLFIHENVSGFYRVSAYFLAKLVFDVFPMRALPILLFASVTYWMIGLRSLFWWSFPFYLLNTIMTSLAGTSVALIFSASSRVHTIGTILTALVWTFMMVFSGLLVNVNTVPVWLQQLKYLSIFRYSMNSFLVNELKDAQFCDAPDVIHPNNTVCDYGNSYLTKQGIAFETTWDLWSNQVALLCLATVFLAITYVQLRRIKKLH